MRGLLLQHSAAIVTTSASPLSLRCSQGAQHPSLTHGDEPSLPSLYGISAQPVKELPNGNQRCAILNYVLP
ncbi:hypothetical protein HOY80DRAFT_743850 [Tuber brumale]|nr:hypothetical protein HOY80DRAFT_743850 [Tuber brumale]